jgi:hypothetical protein
MIEQLREHLQARPFQPFGMELSTGRTLNVYDPAEVAVTLEGHGAVAIAHNGAFVVVNPRQIVSIGPPHKTTPWPEDTRKRMGLEPAPEPPPPDDS